MSFLLSDLLPPVPRPVERSRQIFPGTDTLTQGGTTVGHVYCEAVIGSPDVTVEHWALFAGKPDRSDAATEVVWVDPATLRPGGIHDPLDFFEAMWTLYPNKAGQMRYDRVVCTSYQGVPNGNGDTSVPSSFTAARVISTGLDGFVFVRNHPTQGQRLIEHWALDPSYVPPSPDYNGTAPWGITIAPLVLPADADVAGATTADAFLKVMYTRQQTSQSTWTYISGDCLRTIGIPTP